MPKWLVLRPIVKVALYTGIAGTGASVLAAWNGTVTWHETIGVAIGAAIAVIGGYFAPDSTP